jgi:site-specific DNA-cytosine methylase
MQEGINVVSAFDGMGCLRIALEQLGIKVNKYFAIEIDKHAIKTCKHNFPDVIHLGDITNVTKKDFGGLHIHLLGAGSPC